MSRRLRPLLWRYRWLVVAACLGCVAWLVVAEIRPPPPATVPVVVAARDLPAGTRLATADLATVLLPRAPAGAVDAAAAVGTTVTIGVPAGLPVVETMLLGPGLAQAAPPGWVVAPVPLADPVLAQLLRVGDRVDLYLAAADTGGRLAEATLVAAGALVMARAGPEDDAGSFLAGPQPQTDVVVVVALPATDAAALAGASGFGPFRAVLSAS